MSTNYQPRNLRPWSIPSMILRSLAYILRHWFLFALIVMIISPTSPHLRWQYRYYDRGTTKHMIDCTYLGTRGYVNYRRGFECPIVVVIDTRKVH